ncbi:hypothetical protein PVL29_010661 [Vitis rotundifolia]|uniref:Uncharacterized protein n=1 Tax=Vitis rotundifolia TaxID=103349 RepID=A0AA38ZU05_VITRO|nr:hypothetical protein PVL29_010661 [Vitis rotundifolia]
MALLADAESSLALFFRISPSSPPSINVSTAFSTSHFFTKTPTLSSSPHLTGTSTPNLTPILKTSIISFSFKNCSANNGHVIIGTPEHTPSTVEFQPQWNGGHCEAKYYGSLKARSSTSHGKQASVSQTFELCQMSKKGTYPKLCSWEGASVVASSVPMVAAAYP